MREVGGARVEGIHFRAVAQPGRAPGSGRLPNKFTHAHPRVFMRVFIGKSINQRELTLTLASPNRHA